MLLHCPGSKTCARTEHLQCGIPFIYEGTEQLDSGLVSKGTSNGHPVSRYYHQ